MFNVIHSYKRSVGIFLINCHLPTAGFLTISCCNKVLIIVDQWELFAIFALTFVVTGIILIHVITFLQNTNHFNVDSSYIHSTLSSFILWPSFCRLVFASNWFTTHSICYQWPQYDVFANRRILIPLDSWILHPKSSPRLNVDIVFSVVFRHPSPTTESPT